MATTMMMMIKSGRAPTKPNQNKMTALDNTNKFIYDFALVRERVRFCVCIILTLLSVSLYLWR